MDFVTKLPKTKIGTRFKVDDSGSTYEIRTLSTYSKRFQYGKAHTNVHQ